jgi:hypothetical protein
MSNSSSVILGPGSQKEPNWNDSDAFNTLTERSWDCCSEFEAEGDEQLTQQDWLLFLSHSDNIFSTSSDCTVNEFYVTFP